MVQDRAIVTMGEGNLRPRRPPHEYLGKYTSQGKPPADRMLMDPGHKASKNPSDNADLGIQAIGPVLHIMQLNVEGLSAEKRHIRILRIREEEWRTNRKSHMVY